MAGKLTGLRIFPDDRGLMNRSLADTGGALLLVSQFTLHGDARHGRRPSFIAAAREPEARRLFELVGSSPLKRPGYRLLMASSALRWRSSWSIPGR